MPPKKVDLRFVPVTVLWLATIGCSPNYVLPDPIILGFSPPRGKEGTLITIDGSTLDGNTTFSINGLAAPIATVNSSIRALILVPAGATTGKLKATNESGSGFSTTTFEVIPPPTIESFSPTSGSAGTEVTVTGSNFGPDLKILTVYFNGKKAVISQKSPSFIKTNVPAGATSGKISVSGDGGLSSSLDDFIVN